MKIVLVTLVVFAVMITFCYVHLNKVSNERKELRELVIVQERIIDIQNKKEERYKEYIAAQEKAIAKMQSYLDRYDKIVRRQQFNY